MKRLVLIILAAISFCNADTHFNQLISPEAIAESVRTVGMKIDQDYQEEELTIVMVMKGAVCLTADLIRNIHIPFSLEYVQASSYGQRGTERGEIIVKGLEELDIEGKHVLLVDDIFDTGQTMTTLMSELSKKNPKSLKSLVLLVKNVPRTTSYLPDYPLFFIDDSFVIGYGLDFKELFRGVPGIYEIVQD